VKLLISRLRPDDEVISGGARGVDKVAEIEAKIRGLKVKSYRPVKIHNSDYVCYEFPENQFVIGSPVGSFRDIAFYRNGLIALNAERLYAFWDGTSTGTADTISQYKDRGAEPVIYYPDTDEDVIQYGFF
jgi:hypothetical protein